MWLIWFCFLFFEFLIRSYELPDPEVETLIHEQARTSAGSKFQWTLLVSKGMGGGRENSCSNVWWNRKQVRLKMWSRFQTLWKNLIFASLRRAYFSQPLGVGINLPWSLPDARNFQIFWWKSRNTEKKFEDKVKNFFSGFYIISIQVFEFFTNSMA